MLVIFGVVVVLACMMMAPFYLMIATQNRLVALDQRCDTAFADIDVHLKHRQNLIPALVETVRGFANHEQGILTGITEARTAALRATTPEARLNAERDLTQTINAVIGMADRFPELAASSHFSALRGELVDSENRITASRRFYNLAVGEYDATLGQFPGNMIARRRNLNPRKPFDLGIERVLIDEPIAIKF
jgi:LemA protein